MSSNIQSLGACAIPPIVHPVRIGVVGCGYWGMNYVRILSELMESRLVAICDGRSERLREVGGRFPGVHLTIDVEDIASHPEIDAVVVCTEAKNPNDETLVFWPPGNH